MSKIEIKTLKIQLKNETIELSVDEAKKLQEALNELFKKEIIVKEEHHHYPDWRWYANVVDTGSPAPLNPTWSPGTPMCQNLQYSSNSLKINLEN